MGFGSFPFHPVFCARLYYSLIALPITASVPFNQHFSPRRSALQPPSTPFNQHFRPFQSALASPIAVLLAPKTRNNDKNLTKDGVSICPALSPWDG
ncbi:uncharacterized protein BKA78DRAFT_311651 [Phyllosticta capitalensis]|uniref:uncharacterized protein n=1 Tax=Phyllosticta capitalensis TaxID=121624 RepID=UPI00312D33B0